MPHWSTSEAATDGSSSIHWSATAGRAVAASSAVFVGSIDEVVVGYIVADLGDDDIVRIDQVWVTPEARETRLR